MNTLQKKKLRGTGVNCGLIVLLFAVVLLLGQVLPDNTYRRVLVPIIWQMCIFILLGTSRLAIWASSRLGTWALRASARILPR